MSFRLYELRPNLLFSMAAITCSLQTLCNLIKLIINHNSISKNAFGGFRFQEINLYPEDALCVYKKRTPSNKKYLLKKLFRDLQIMTQHCQLKERTIRHQRDLNLDTNYRCFFSC